MLMGGDNNNLSIDRISLTEYCGLPDLNDLQCDDYVYLADHTLLGDTYHVSEFLKSDGNVAPGNFTIFKAENEILLMPQFTVPQSAVFEATIESCQ